MLLYYVTYNIGLKKNCQIFLNNTKEVALQLNIKVWWQNLPKHMQKRTWLCKLFLAL